MEYWIVILSNIILGIVIAHFNVLIAVPIVLTGLILGLILIIFKKLGGKDDV